MNDRYIHLETKGGLSKIIKNYICDKIGQCKGKCCINSSAFPMEFCVNTLSSECRCLNFSLGLKATAITQIKYNTNKKLGTEMLNANLIFGSF